MMGRIRHFLLAFLVALLVSRVLGAEPVDDLRVYQTPGESKQARSMLQQYLGEKM